MPRREDDEFEPPRRRRPRDDEDDEVDRPRREWDDQPPAPRRRRKRRRGSGGMSVGKAFAIVGGIFGVCAVIAVVVVLVNRGGTGLFGADISYEKWKAINRTDTLEGLEKRFGKPERIERADWAKTQLRIDPNMEREGPRTLADYSRGLSQIEAWYRWRNGPEDVYVAVGADENGQKGRLIVKGYTNTKATQQNAGKVDLNNIDITKLVPGYHFEPIR